MAEGVGVEYGRFIREAYIDPIRSVLIIDDDYPTLEEVLSPDRACKNTKSWKSDPGPILEVLDNFRKDSPGRLVDVHDGKLTDDEGNDVAKHLHQSDLLVLDYELNDRGQGAIKIIDKVLRNSHFNLIVVHSNKQPHDTYKEILFSLIKVDELLTTDAVSAGEIIIQDAEDDFPNADEQIRSAVGLQQYVCFRKHGKKLKKKVLDGEAPFGDFKERCDQIGVSRRNMVNVFYWAIKKYEIQNKELFAEEDIDLIDYNSHESRSALWIRTPQGFLTFIKKSQGNNLLDMLQDALLAWGPTPSRLLLSKLRSVVDDRGVIAEDKILETVSGHAKFFEKITSQTSDAGKRYAIDSQIDRYMGGITSEVKKQVTDYFISLVSDNQEFEKTYSVDFANTNAAKTALTSYNAYVSCLPRVSGWHLAPGHIIKLVDSNELWVCLSPICDLVPGQKKEVGIYGNLGPNRKPFLAAKLFERGGELSGKQIQSNSFLFIEMKPGEIDQYCFYEGSETPENSFSPHWTLFIAENRGEFSEENPTLNLSKFDSMPIENRALRLKKMECEIVAQLRYEYALNLINKLGNDMTRVGLDFLSPS